MYQGTVVSKLIKWINNKYQYSVLHVYLSLIWKQKMDVRMLISVGPFVNMCALQLHYIVWLHGLTYVMVIISLCAFSVISSLTCSSLKPTGSMLIDVD